VPPRILWAGLVRRLYSGASTRPFITSASGVKLGSPPYVSWADLHGLLLVYFLPFIVWRRLSTTIFFSRDKATLLLLCYILTIIWSKVTMGYKVSQAVPYCTYS
jgi:hypothetical protein